MPESVSHAVFLSYASQDGEKARGICEALRQAGLEVWFDQSELRGGDVWDQKIRRQIRECALFLPLISANTNARAEGYFRLEWRLAVDRSLQMADDATFLVPAVIDDMPDAAARVPDRFRDVQWMRVLTPEAATAFAARVRALLEAPAVTPPSATRPPVAAPSAETRPTRRSAPAPAMETVGDWRPAAGQLVPGIPWALERKLGEGGFGEVWLGRHQTMKERRVFKFCFEPERVRSLKREMTLFRVLKERIGAHPNIVRLLDVHFDEPPFYLEMDYVEGQSLKAWCELQGGVDKVPLATRLEIVAQTADALHAAHTAGVIHRDVKPGNILISQAAAAGAPPIPKLSDFGIGQIVSDEALAGVTKSGFTKSIVADSSAANSGTQIYMAPELLVGEPATPRSDLYSLGVVLFQLAAGDLHKPLTTDWPRVIADPVLQEDLARCFAGRPEERFASAEQLAQSLRTIESRRAARREREAAAAARARVARRWRLGLGVGVGALVLGLGTSLTLFLQRSARLRHVREVVVPEIERLAAAQDNGAAFALAQSVLSEAPDEPALKRIWGQVSVVASVESTPTGADVYAREYRKPDSPWRHLGQTPLKDVRLPRALHRWKLEKAGLATLERAAPAAGNKQFSLEPADAVPPDMVPVAGVTTNSIFTGFPAVKFGDYFIDRFEVTNRQFKQFVDQGGYAKAEYWKQPFVKAGETLTREQALAGFVDATGRPGPATWRNGTHAEAEADFPVTGVSWFEAAAYAEFVGKRLPSVAHWRVASQLTLVESIVPLSNFSNKSLARVGGHQGMSACGVFDLAGNAKEWCWNEALPGTRYILGGAWNEPDYMFVQADALSAFDRSAANGFRCVKLRGDGALDAAVDKPVPPRERDYANERPVNDETFRVFLSLYSYDKSPLDARLEATDNSDPRWRKEKVSFNAAYGGERMGALVFLPKKSVPPYQTVVYFPGAGALAERSSERLRDLERVTDLVETGRAVVYPIYKNTYERGSAGSSPLRALQSAGYRDFVVMLAKDLGRTIDYLETRSDFQLGKLAYVGLSLGGALGAILPAIETRIRVNVLIIGGFFEAQVLPEADQINFTPRNKVPTLMLSGRYDFRFPLETSQRPMFRWLGAPSEHKKHVLFDTGHALTQAQVASEAHAWLDKYLGPVK